MNKTALLSIFSIGLVSMSATAGTLNTELAKCSQVKDSLARLVCFDDLAKTASLSPVSEKQSSTSVPIAKKSARIEPIVSKEANFGAEHLKKTNVSEDDLQVVFVVEKLKKDQYGKWRFTFKNGQQWKQSDSSHFRVNIGESVLLKKGFMDAVYLKKNKADSNKKIRVKRIK
jgi:hypothetical protein